MHEKYIQYGTPFVKLAEECAEVIKVCMKIERFGLKSSHPITKVSNIEALLSEMQDVLHSINVAREFIEKESK